MAYFGTTRRFGQIWMDAPKQSTMEILNEFFEEFDEVAFPNGKRYRLDNDVLYLKLNDKWYISDLTFNKVLRLFDGFKPEDWLEVMRKSVRRKAPESWQEAVSEFAERFEKEFPTK